MSNASTFLAIPNKNHQHDFRDIQNVPSAGQTQAGMVKITSDVNSTSEEHAITAKAFKTFADHVSEQLSQAGTIQGNQTINGNQIVNGKLTVNGAAVSKTFGPTSISEINWDYSGFYRTNNAQLNGKATPGLVMWAAHSAGKANGGGIGFGYASSDTFRLYFDATGNYAGMVKMYTEDYHPAADKLTTARKITFTGDVTGNYTFDGTADKSVALEVDPTKHAHEISHVTGLTTALSKKLDSTANAATATKFAEPMTLKLAGEVTGTASISGDAEVSMQATLSGTVGRSLAVTGALTATGDITAFYSDARLKTIQGKLTGALDKLKLISAYYTTPNDVMQKLCPDVPTEADLTLLVQEVNEALPLAIAPAQFDHDDEGKSISGQDYKTIKMMKMIPLLVEAVKELALEVEQLRR